MANLDSLTVKVDIDISNETVLKCASLLAMAKKPFSEGEIVTVIDERNNYTGYHVVKETKVFENGGIGIVLEKVGDLV